MLQPELIRRKISERTVWDYLERQIRREQDLKDLEIINKKARQLNLEAEDVLSYQADL